MNPGTLTFTNGIPTGLVNDHNEAFFYWWKFGMQDAVLFHVDAHPDMWDLLEVNKEISSANDYKKMSIENFICPAVHHNLISSVYWLNPHSEERRLQDLGSNKHDGRQYLSTFFGLDQKHLQTKHEERLVYEWAAYGHDLKSEIRFGKREIISPKKIVVPKESPLILDIDLDAFCCHVERSLRFLPSGRNVDDDVLDYRTKIDQTMEVLSYLPNPSLITIASSQGDGENGCFVPPFMLKEVSHYLAKNLKELY